MSTNRARVMQFKPWKQAIIMINMLTRHLPHLHTFLKLILTNSTLIQLRAQQRIINSYRWKILNSLFRCRRCSVTVRIILCELLNQLLEASTEEVIAKVRGNTKPRFGFRRIIDLELNVCTVGVKAVEMILKESEWVETVGIGSGPGNGSRIKE
uniref:Uncharacterized protein n=1 Tax=Medicago truncatula TaxID=3880 RepID=I3SRW0_MEDTR|nr:unknown [Medicago truncatula]